MDYKKEALNLHEKLKGKLSVESKNKIKTRDDLSIMYTPGVAAPCEKIRDNKADVYKYTIKKNMVAVVSDGTAVLGLGNIGASAAIPVMEGKAVLFKEFADVDAFPICVDSSDVDKVVETVKLISPVFGGINLEDISSNTCVEVETKLKEELDIPVFHDDQHGTAVVVSAGVINALKVVNKSIENIKVVINGGGSAGYAITKMLINLGVSDIIVCDIDGILNDKNANNFVKKEIVKMTKTNNLSGDLSDAIKDRDVFIGVSAGNIVSSKMVESMNENAIIFAMANPEPEIMPDKAKKAGARVIGTGRSDFANQVNNVLAFPGIFRGALDVLATDITEGMKVAATYAIAEYLRDDQINEENILPSALDKGVATAVATAVGAQAKKEGVVKNIEESKN